MKRSHWVVLLDRQLSRLSGIDATAVRYRRVTDDPGYADRLDQGIRTLETVADRLAFCRPPFTLTKIAASADAFGAGLLLLDYLQRIVPPGVHSDRRTAVDATMDYLRQFADAGVAVLVVAAVGRTKDTRGRSSYVGDGLNLASFRESSELEFGADDAFILAPGPKVDEMVTLKPLKSRHGECRDVAPRFEKSIQRFIPTDAGTEWNPNAGLLSNALSRLGCETEAAGNGPTDDCGFEEFREALE